MGGGISLHGNEKVVKAERYKIYLYSGPHLESGSDAEISFTIIGKSGKSTSKKATATLASAKSRGTLKRLEDGTHIESFHFKAEDDLSDLGAVEVVNRGEGPQADWEVHKVVVEKTMEDGVKCGDVCWQRWVFPCYAWVQAGASRVFFHGGSYLPQHTPVWMQSTRTKELDKQKDGFNWGSLPGLPGLVSARQIEELPRDERIPVSFVSDPKIATANTVGVLGEMGSWDDISDNNWSAGTLHGTMYVNPTDHPEAYSRRERKLRVEGAGEGGESAKAPQGLPAPDAALSTSVRWDDDVAFGRQMLQGTNPVMFRAVFDFPEEFVNLTDDMLEGVLRPRRTLESEFQEGRIFLLDYRGLWPHKPAEFTGKFSAGPVCLLYSTEIERSGGSLTPVLVPLAIKLHPEVWDAPIWTPKDDVWQWNLAKSWVQCCDAQFHMCINYYLHTRGGPYFKYMLAHGIISRRSLMGHGGIVESLFTIGEDVADFTSQEYKGWRLEDMGLPASLVKRGLDGTEKLPDYPYRDDGMLVWGALVDFVSSYVACYYRSTEDVLGDSELQLWMKEIRAVGHPEVAILGGGAGGEGAGGGGDGGDRDGGGRGPALADVDTLEMLLATTMWTCSAHRSALTYNRYDAYGFPPNKPVAMRKPPPPDKSGGLIELLDSLPGQGDSATLACYMFHSTERSPLGEALGEGKEEWISDAPAVAALDQFRTSLDKIEQVINMRNDRRLVPYEVMLPSKIRCCPV